MRYICQQRMLQRGRLLRQRQDRHQCGGLGGGKLKAQHQGAQQVATGSGNSKGLQLGKLCQHTVGYTLCIMYCCSLHLGIHKDDGAEINENV